MNKLSRADRVAILRCLTDGCSIRATTRITAKSKNTVIKLLVDIGPVASDIQDQLFRNLDCQRLQADEIWSFVGAKQKNVAKGAQGIGDVWTWTAIDADSKLVPTWLVGPRDGDTATAFMLDVASRIANRPIQLTTDGHQPYVEAVEAAFGCDIDYAMLIKEYSSDADQKRPEKRYSPGKCSGTRTEVKQGSPDPAAINTSYVERQNLTMRMNMRRFTRLTNAFSKKVENHAHAIALHFFHYNLVRIHKTLRVTPAMAAGATDRLWSLEDLVDELERREAEATANSPIKPGRKPKAAAQDAAESN